MFHIYSRYESLIINFDTIHKIIEVNHDYITGLNFQQTAFYSYYFCPPPRSPQGKNEDIKFLME